MKDDAGTPAKRRYWFEGHLHEEQNDYLREALDPEIWERGGRDAWDMCWYTGMPEKKEAVFDAAAAERKVNHIPGNNALTLKSGLFRTLSNARRRMEGHDFQSRYRFFPDVYSMPEDYHALQEAALAEPDKLWILKPKGSSRGRGIRVLEDAALAPKSGEWMVQEYLHRPHLYQGHKYVMRCYVLITAVEPLTAYVYEEGFVKLASEKYTTEDLDNLFIHLTNPDVNETNATSDAPVVFIPFSDYRQWLRDEGADDEKLFDELYDLITLTVMAARERLLKQCEETGTDPAGCYEFTGLDCMVDADLRPWILECNLSPSMDICALPEHGGIAEDRIRRKLMTDMANLLGFNDPRPPAATLEEQLDREAEGAGGFVRLMPSCDPERYLPCFPVPRYGDMRAAAHVASHAHDVTLKPGAAEEIIAGETLTLFDTERQIAFAPNEMASLIWLKLANGMSVASLATALAAQATESGQMAADEVRALVWNAAAEWAYDGLLIPASHGSQPSAQAPTETETASGWAQEWALDLGGPGGAFRLRAATQPVAARLAVVLDLLPQAAAGATTDTGYDVVPAADGYAISDGRHLTGTGLRLSRLAPFVRDRLLGRMAALSENEVILRATGLSADGKHLLIASTLAGGLDDVLLTLTEIHPGSGLLGGASRITAGSAGRATVLPLPFAVTHPAPPPVKPALAASAQTRMIHEWQLDRPCRLIPVSEAAAPEASLPINGIVIPYRIEDSDTESSNPTTGGAEDRAQGFDLGISRLDTARALTELIALRVAPLSTDGAGELLAGTKDRRPKSSPDIRALSSWLEGLPVYGLGYRDPQVAAREIVALI